MNENEPKMKQCPFCGGSPRYYEIQADENTPNAGGEYIECAACGASTVIMFSLKDDARPHLIDRWNCRQYPRKKGMKEKQQ